MDSFKMTKLCPSIIGLDLVTLCYGLSVVITMVACLFLVRAYIQMTIGICRCDASMAGKTVIVTGANSGIGKETARELAKHDARVILACRNPEKAEKAKSDIIKSTGNNDVIFMKLDLGSFDSVRTFAKNFLATEQRLDVLINNAGIMGTAKRKITVDGCEDQIQSNHLGHFLLTNLLLGILKDSAPSRIINVSSFMYLAGSKNWDDLQRTSKYFQATVYCSSKLANIYFTRELSKRLEGTGVTVNCLNPGLVKTELTKHPSFMAIIGKIGFLIFGKTALEGAQTSLHLALSKHLATVTGQYFRDCKETKLAKIALDEEAGKKLWSLSETTVGL